MGVGIFWHSPIFCIILSDQARFFSFIMLGVKTGKCVNTSKAQSDPVKKVCEIYAWCPVEIDTTPMPIFNLRQATFI